MNRKSSFDQLAICSTPYDKTLKILQLKMSTRHTSQTRRLILTIYGTLALIRFSLFMYGFTASKIVGKPSGALRDALCGENIETT